MTAEGSPWNEQGKRGLNQVGMVQQVERRGTGAARTAGQDNGRPVRSGCIGRLDAGVSGSLLLERLVGCDKAEERRLLGGGDTLTFGAATPLLQQAGRAVRGTGVVAGRLLRDLDPAGCAAYPSKGALDRRIDQKKTK